MTSETINPPRCAKKFYQYYRLNTEARDRNVAIANALHGLAEEATPRSERFSRKEVRYVPVVNMQDIRREADDYARRARAIMQKSRRQTGILR